MRCAGERPGEDQPVLERRAAAYAKRDCEVRLRAFPGIGHTWSAGPVGELRTTLDFVFDN